MKMIKLVFAMGIILSTSQGFSAPADTIKKMDQMAKELELEETAQLKARMQAEKMAIAAETEKKEKERNAEIEKRRLRQVAAEFYKDTPWKVSKAREIFIDSLNEKTKNGSGYERLKLNLAIAKTCGKQGVQALLIGILSFIPAINPSATLEAEEIEPTYYHPRFYSYSDTGRRNFRKLWMVEKENIAA